MTHAPSETDHYRNALEAAAFLRARIPFTAPPRTAVILGSGLGAFADGIQAIFTVAYRDIPHFPKATVQGHSGRLLAATVRGCPILVLQGRVHGYEGYTPAQTTFPVRVLGLLGIKSLIVTNAAGGIRTSYRPGQLVALSDHINFTGLNPAAGENDDRFGQRFFDMSESYSRSLRKLAAGAAEDAGLVLEEGIYLGLGGPSFETPAEIRAFRILGADLVGMSTVHEVIVARHMGIAVLGLSCVTNMAAGILDQPLSHQEVEESGRRVQGDFSRLLYSILARIAAQPGQEAALCEGPA